jgi:hypothetical protein
MAWPGYGWPVFPCLPGEKIPATAHGFRDATTDEQQITGWFGRGFAWNLAIATGAPAPTSWTSTRVAFAWRCRRQKHLVEDASRSRPAPWPSRWSGCVVPGHPPRSNGSRYPVERPSGRCGRAVIHGVRHHQVVPGTLPDLAFGG